MQRLVRAFAPGQDMGFIDHAFDLLEAGCTGRLDGYAALQPPYHDQVHMLEVVLCSVRLLHALHLGGQPIDALTIDARALQVFEQPHAGVAQRQEACVHHLLDVSRHDTAARA